MNFTTLNGRTTPTTTTTTTKPKQRPTPEALAKAYQEAKKDAFEAHLHSHLDEALALVERAAEIMEAVRIPKKFDKTTNSEMCRKDCRGTAYILRIAEMQIRDVCGLL